MLSYSPLELGPNPLKSLATRLRHYIAAADLLAQEQWTPRPFIIGITGAVAAGKSTLAQQIATELADLGKIQILSTDNFLYSNAQLNARRISHRKGFPESYDTARLISVLQRIKRGENLVQTPVYSHDTYDIVDNLDTPIDAPRILLLEGVNVLQVTGELPLISDHLNVSIYIDAKESDLIHWFKNRFINLREGALLRPDSFYHQFANLSLEEITLKIDQVWDEVNALNLHEYILPTRLRANLVVSKQYDHSITRITERQM